MLVSSGLRRTPPGINMLIWPLSHQDIPGFDSGGEGGGVYSPPRKGRQGLGLGQVYEQGRK